MLRPRGRGGFIPRQITRARSDAFLLERLECRRLISGTLEFNRAYGLADNADASAGLNAIAISNLALPYAVPAGATLNPAVTQAAVVTLSMQPDGSAYYGQTMYFTIRVAPAVPGGPVPTGTVNVQDGHNSYSFSLSNGVIQLYSSNYLPGDYQLTAHYNGDSNYDVADSNTLAFSVTPTPTTLTLTGPATACLQSPVALSAHVTSPLSTSIVGTLTVDIPGRAPDSITVVGGVATYTYTPVTLAELNVSATFSSGGHFASSSTTLAIPFAKASFPLSLSISGPSSLPSGRQSTLTASFSPPGPFVFDAADTVTFYDGDSVLGTVPLSNGSASLDVRLFTPGIHPLRASFTGDPNLEDAAVAANLTITPASIINLLVLYTSDVSGLVDAGGNPTDELRGDIQSVNDAFTNSGIPATLVLSYAQQVSYVSRGNYQQDLSRLETPNDGYLDNVFGLRQQYHADLVTLFVLPYGKSQPGDPPDMQMLGLGDELLTTAGDPNAAFSVIQVDSAGDNYYTLAHELGHNLGASHDSQNNPHPNPAFPSGQGYRFTNEYGYLYHDIMAYDPGDVIPYYSNPQITYEDVPEGRKGSADAAHVIMKTAPLVANYHLLIAPPPPNAVPQGALEIKSNQVVSGWAFDPDAGAGSVKVRLDVDGQPGLLLDADLDRPDLVLKLGSANHGFSFDTSTLALGTHTITVYIINLPGDSGADTAMLLGRFTLANAVPNGTLEIVNQGVIAGWADDKDMPAEAVQVRIDVDGNTGELFTADLSRPDLVKKLGSANHGFYYELPSRTDFGAHIVRIYFYDVNTGIPCLIRTCTLRTTNVLPAGKIETANLHAVTGWAFDQNLASAPVYVVMTLDDGTASSNAADSRPNLVAKFGSAAHGFSFTLPADLAVGKHVVSVYAVNAPAAAAPQDRVLIGRCIVTNHAPIVSLEIINGTTIAGWAYDPDVPDASIGVNMNVDNSQYYDSFSAQLGRPDLLKRLGSTAHGFSYELPTSTTAGPHTVSISVTDPQSDEVIQYRTFTVNTANVAPTGKLETATYTTLAGWAFDQNAGSQSIQLRVDIDGTTADIVTADVARNDLLKSLGSVNHGFSYAFSALSPGRHAISLSLLDEFSGLWVPWKKLTVTAP